MADPTVIDCSTPCTVTVVHELALPPLQLTTQDAGLIAASILLVWAVGYAFRMFIRALNVDEKGTADGSRSDD